MTANPGFWHRFADWLHREKDAVEPGVMDAVKELHALATEVTTLRSMLTALAAHVGPAAVDVINAVESGAVQVATVTAAVESASGETATSAPAEPLPADSAPPADTSGK